jgi:hypothetical protein
MTKLIMAFDHRETEEVAIAAFAGQGGVPVRLTGRVPQVSSSIIKWSGVSRRRRAASGSTGKACSNPKDQPAGA